MAGFYQGFEVVRQPIHSVAVAAQEAGLDVSGLCRVGEIGRGDKCGVTDSIGGGPCQWRNRRGTGLEGVGLGAASDGGWESLPDLLRL